MPTSVQPIRCPTPGLMVLRETSSSGRFAVMDLISSVKTKSINTIKSIGLMMARAIHFLSFICKIGDNERDVIITCSTNNDKIYFECEMKCGRHCIFNNREYQQIGKHVSNSNTNKD